MDLAGLSLLIGAASVPATAIVTALVRAWRSAIQRAVVEQQATATIAAKNRELDELRRQNAELWRLLEGLTQ